MARWFSGITDSMDMNYSKLREIVKDREACHVIVHTTEQLNKPIIPELSMIMERLCMSIIQIGSHWLHLDIECLKCDCCK